MKKCMFWLSILVFFAGCGGEGVDHTDTGEGGHSHDNICTHGGFLVEGREGAFHIELVHDEKAGSVKFYLTGKEGKNPLPIADAPELKLVTAKGPKVLKSTAVGCTGGESAEFMITDDVLHIDPLVGRVSIKVDGKEYNPEIHDDHDHDTKGEGEKK